MLSWDYPTHGLIPPTTLVPLAEQSGAMNDIGRWVLERVTLGSEFCQGSSFGRPMSAECLDRLLPSAANAEPRTWWHVRYDPGLP